MSPRETFLKGDILVYLDAERIMKEVFRKAEERGDSGWDGV